MEIKKFSKEKLLNLAGQIGNATKNTVANIGETTKNIASTAVENMKKSSEEFNEKRDQTKLENDKKKLCPVYKEELLSEDFVIPSLVCVVEYDMRKENKACEGAVGFYTGKDVKILNIYREYVELLNLEFFPFLEDSVYHVDPCYSNHYIKLDEYFAFLKKVRVEELTALAQDLGAKHVEIALRSNQNSAASQFSSVGFSGLKIGGEASVSRSNSDRVGVEVAAKADFGGSDTPVQPKLVYFKNESDILSLIKMRLNPAGGNNIISKTYLLQYGNSSGIKVSDAQKIEAALSGASIGMSHSFSSEANYENSTVLEYTISF